MINKDLQIEVFILAGGKSRRMGSDKATLELGETSMLGHLVNIVQEMAWPFAVISSNELHRSANYRIVGDSVQEKGPMGGLYTALNYANSSWVMLLACDMPALSRSLINAMIKQTKNISADILVASYQGKLHPLFACYNVNILPKVHARIESNHLEMRDLILSENYQTMKLDSLIDNKSDPLININTPEDYDKFVGDFFKTKNEIIL